MTCPDSVGVQVLAISRSSAEKLKTPTREREFQEARPVLRFVPLPGVSEKIMPMQI
jgi:vacuolar-type H+-ATPase subunit F/Vma7